jgi:hypothetical protein
MKYSKRCYKLFVFVLFKMISVLSNKEFCVEVENNSNFIVFYVESEKHMRNSVQTIAIEKNN